MKPINTSNFWYRRALAIILASCLIAVSLSLASYLWPDVPFLSTAVIEMPSVVITSLAASISLVGLIIKKGTATWMISFLAFVLTIAATLLMILDSGGLDSPFVAIWVLLAAFSYLWDWPGLILTSLTSLLFGGYLAVSTHATEMPIIGLLAAFILPLIVSFISLRLRVPEKQKDDYAALANELSQVANKSEIVINAIGDGVIATDNSGIIQLINPAAQKIMGWGKQDALGLDYRSVFKLNNSQKEDAEVSVDPVQQVLRGGESTTTNDLVLTTKSGKKINISIMVSPVGQASTAGAIVVFRDITADVSENQQRTEFISTASHEMRTPVAAIEGYLGLALNPSTAQIDENARKYITKAHEASQHLGRLFQDLLDISKAEDGRLKSNPTIVDLTKFVRESVGLFKQSATDKGLSLIFRPDSNDNSDNNVAPIFYAEIDLDHLREIMTNLIENAIKYTKKGTVEVNLTGNDQKVQICVSDTGIGIAREDIPHLFQKFYRIDNSDTREIGGTGLGLYLCRRLAESMNGRIWLESEQGKGSTFFVELNRLSSDEVNRRNSQTVIAPEQGQP